MVKAGIYLLARLSPVLGGTDLWVGAVAGAGAHTMLLGAWLAILQTDLKRILAYSTVSSLGTLTVLLGVGGERAVVAAVAYLFAHALFKGSLFLVAGTVDHEAGTRDVRRLGKLARAMPLTAAAAALAALSMAGVAPFFGFLAKELLYEAALRAPLGAGLATAAVVTANVFTVALACVVGFGPFWRGRAALDHAPHEAPPSLWLGPLVAAAIGLIIGLAPWWGADPLVSAAGASVLAAPVDVHLALWHGVNLPLVLSLLTVAAGIGLYGVSVPLRNWAADWRSIAQWGPARWYSAALHGTIRFAEMQTRFLQSGNLRYYLLTILVVLVGLTGSALVRGGWRRDAGDWSDIRFYDVGLVMLIVPAALAAVLLKKRLAAIAALGVVGIGVALVFVLFGAPDVAMTQFLVETLTVIVFVLVFYHLPEPAGLSTSVARLRDAFVAVAVGLVMSLLVLVAADARNPRHVSDYYLRNSVPQAHGRNVVNVILVDFRGLDTLGEITVLAVAGIGVYALLKLRPVAADASAAALHPQTATITESESSSETFESARPTAAPFTPSVPGPDPASSAAEEKPT
jgi:multicomponent Na+:H+ antiporter subunit A